MRGFFRLCVLSFVALVLCVAFTSNQSAMAQAEDDVVINEFSVNPATGREYVELLVTKAGGVNMQSWTISDVNGRAGTPAATEGDVILPASATYLSNVPQGTYVVIVGSQGASTAATPNVIPEDTSTSDGNNRLVLVVGTTAGLTTTGTATNGGGFDNSTNENLQLYAGTRASGTLIDQVLAGSAGATSFVAGASWGDNNGATTTDNINGGSSMPSNSIARFVPASNTLAGFQDNDTNARWFVDPNSYGSPGFRNAGVLSDSAVNTAFVPPDRIADFDGDGRTDVSVWRSDERNWYYIRSSDNQLVTHLDWGGAILNDVAVPGDYDGDNKTDLAVWRPSDGNWYIIRSSNGSILIQGWGGSGDKPVPGDYDGDGDTDFGIFRASEGNWYILNNGTGAVTLTQWGASTDIPVPGEYDGDGKTDIAVFRPAEGNWYIMRSSGGNIIQQWGVSGDTLIPADYDADNITDVAVYRASEGNWYIRKSGGGLTVRGWGASTDKPVPGDYDGDGRADIAIYRPSEGNWYIIRSSDNVAVLANLLGNTPVPYAYLPQYYQP